MIDIFITCLKSIKNYTGLRPLLFITAIAWLVLFFKERSKARRIVLVLMPLVMVLAYICPLTYYLFDKVGLDTEIYYRLLWIIPMGVITVYAIVGFLPDKAWKRILAVLIASLLIMVSGRCIYKSESFYKSQNIYGLPDNTIAVIDYIRSIDDHTVINLLPSSDLITTIRQYDANICMPYGRDMFNPALNYYSPVYEAFEIPERLSFRELIEASRGEDVEYIVVFAARLLEDDPEEAGFEFVGEVNDHLIYRDPQVHEKISMIEEYYK